MAENVLQVNLTEQQANDVQLALTTFVLMMQFHPELLNILVNKLEPTTRRMFIAALRLALAEGEATKVAELEGHQMGIFMLDLHGVCKRLNVLGATIAAWNLERHPDPAEGK